jgi:hypothetical protein
MNIASQEEGTCSIAECKGKSYRRPKKTLKPRGPKSVKEANKVLVFINAMATISTF